MKEFTIEQLKRTPNLVLDELTPRAGVEITHKNRKNMVLVLKDHYEGLKKLAAKGGE